MSAEESHGAGVAKAAGGNVGGVESKGNRAKCKDGMAKKGGDVRRSGVVMKVGSDGCFRVCTMGAQVLDAADSGKDRTKGRVT